MEHTARTRTLVPGESLAEGFTPSADAPIGPGGEPTPIPAREPLPPPPRPPCLRGPCRNYHRLVTDIDEALPLTGVPDAAAKQTHHYCYPASGIEIELNLGDTAIYECNRWDPELPSDPIVTLRAKRRLQYLTSEGAPAPEGDTSHAHG